ncbi:hypothetical protein RQP46_002204 [Phenoliferia psychrophenolica]
MAGEPPYKVSFGDFSAWVTVAGDVAPVYSVAVKDNTTTAFIEAQEDAPYAIHLLDDQEQPVTGLATRVFIDGTNIVGADNACYQSPKGSMLRIESFYGARDTATSEKPFKFGQLLLTDDADLACSDEKIIQGLGKIELRLYRVGNVVASAGPAVDQAGSSANTPVVHERVKKATLSHATEYGNSVATGSTSGVARYDKIDAEAYHTFEFRYLNRESDDPPAPSGPDQKRKAPDDSDGSDDDDDDVDGKIAALKAKLAKLEGKQKTGEGKQKTGDLKKVKREQGAPDDEGAGAA